jgi:hypothetical protein
MPPKKQKIKVTFEGISDGTRFPNHKSITLSHSFDYPSDVNHGSHLIFNKDGDGIEIYMIGDTLSGKPVKGRYNMYEVDKELRSFYYDEILVYLFTCVLAEFESASTTLNLKRKLIIDDIVETSVSFSVEEVG